MSERRILHSLVAVAAIAWALLHSPLARAAATPPDIAAAAAPFQDNLAQRTLACTACHGREGRAGPDGFYPRIAGKPARYLYHQLLNFREGRRHYGLMQRMVDHLSDDYLLVIAGHFAALDLPYPAPPRVAAAPAVLARGGQLARDGDPALRVPACMQCHGPKLTGTLPAVPGLLGLPLDYLNAQLGAWRTGERAAHAPDCMATIARRLDPADVSAVASWLAAQPIPADSRPDAPPSTALPLDCGSAAVPDDARDAIPAAARAQPAGTRR